MRLIPTVIFADLVGSTGVFEALGNDKATLAVHRLIELMVKTCHLHGGRVVKTLGDGLLAVFADPADALEAIVALQRTHHARTRSWPSNLLMHMKIGAACGPVVELQGDCYGDTVNLAARLCQMAGAGHIWTTGDLVRGLRAQAGTRFRSLGAVNIRGLSEAREICQIDWDTHDPSEMLTQPADSVKGQYAGLADHIALSCASRSASFSAQELPVHLGRLPELEFTVLNQRVSRRHARLDWVNKNFVLTDLSSYGTWVRLGDGLSELVLRRGECVLMGWGEISLGTPFNEPNAPVVRFMLAGGEPLVTDWA